MTVVEYTQHGFVLVPFASGKKGPGSSDEDLGWNLRERCISTAEQAAKLNGGNIGLAHAYARTCAIDMDDFKKCAEWFSERGIDIAALLMREDAVQITSGRPNRAKLLYRLPDGIEPLPTKQVTEVSLELRCATAKGLTMQDVLPPSIHPETGKPYEWKGDWRKLPMLPGEVLAVWQALLKTSEHNEERFDVEAVLAGVPEGQRDITLHKYACSMESRRLPKAEALVLIEQAARNAEPPFDVRAARQKVEAAYSKYEAPVTFDAVMHAAGAFTEKSTPDDVAAVLRDIHSARLRPVEQLAALREIKTKTKIGLGALKEELATIARREATDGDVGLTVAQKVLDRFYAGGQHLVRTQDGSFWAYGGTHWARITDEQVKHAILEVIEADVSPDVGTFSTLMDSAFRLLVAMRAASGDVLRLTEEQPPVVNCKNGELWLGEDGTHELRPHRADSFLTYVLDVAFDPTARCPRFDRALLGIFWSVRRDDKDNVMAHSAAMVRHLYEIIGYAIQPRRWLAVWVMFIGPGNGGKSRVVQTVTEKLMNPRTVFADRISDVEGDRFKRGALAGKLVLLDDDVDADTKLPDGFLKAISERKLLSGQLKFRDSFEFIACCLPILLANNPPTSKDLSWGLRRRAHIVPFERIFHKDRATAVKEGDPRAVDNPKLFPHVWQHEMPGVLNRALQGLQRLRARGRFEEPRACVEARRRWLAAANPLVAFVSEECESSPDLSTLLRDFYVSYQEWAKEAGVRSIEPRNTIKRHLEGLGYKTVASGHGTAVRGLRVQFISARGDIG